MHVSRILPAVALATFLISPAHAAGGSSVGISLGQSDGSDYCDLFTDVSSCDDTDTGVKLYIGRDVNQNFRVEGFWVDLGEVKVTDSVGDSATAEADGFGVAGMGLIPVNAQFGLFGKAGLLRWDSKETFNVGSVTATASDDGVDLMFGVGGRYQVNNRFIIRGEWENFEIDSDETIDVQLLSLGVEFRF